MHPQSHAEQHKMHGIRSTKLYYSFNWNQNRIYIVDAPMQKCIHDMHHDASLAQCEIQFQEQ
jgi:hypothetical protein